jgi:hypothetical protein
MRARYLVVLVALLATVVVPAEAAPVEQAGSVIDQVTSCLQPNGTGREDAAVHDSGSCPERGPVTRVGVAALLLAALLWLAGRGRLRSRPLRPDGGSNRLLGGVARGGASWRAPPVAV